MGFIIDKFLDALENRDKKKKFESNSNCIECIVKAMNYPKFSAIRIKSEKTLYIPFNKYTFRRNDQIIDISDISYFVCDIEQKYEFVLDGDTYVVNKILYDEKPLALPSYLQQQTNNQISITVENSNLNNISACNISTQQLDYTQVLNDLETAINSCYHIAEYQKMISMIKECVQQKKPIEESKFKKFLTFMGTQIRNLFNVFISAYATALANKTF